METSSILLIIVTFTLTVSILLAYLLFQRIKSSKLLENSLKELTSKYGGIINVEEEIERKNKQFEVDEEEFKKRIEETRNSLEELKTKYHSAKDVFDELTRENNLLKDTLDLAEFGVYEPHFDFDTSETYKIKLLENKEKQKILIKNEIAVRCFTDWSVGTSRKQGEIMTRRAIQLTTRAFNGECDSMVAKVKWNNIEQSEKRIEKTFAAINRLNKSNDIHIQPEFFDLKIEEIRLTYEYHMKKYEEKEEQRRIQELMREEEKAQRDFERAIKEAEKEEKLLRQARAKAQEEVAKSTEEERTKYEAQLAEMEEKLKAAEEKSERAISMAQQTKSGHVYVISNIGSFGENIYKIGMTRRLEPLDRVYELGGASVPFRFDVHAMIYSENAPELESQLHKTFNHKRLNLVNQRREYFDISLDEIADVVRENNEEIEFTKVPEAQEYRESLVIRKQLNEQEETSSEPAFPSTEQLFGTN